MNLGKIQIRKQTSRLMLAAALTMTAVSAITVTALPARAQDVDAPVRLAQLSAERSFNIEAQPLTTALTLFGQQSRIQITVHGTLPRNISAPAVRGTMTSEEALTRLLAGSGLTYTASDESTIAIESPGQKDSGGATVLDPITVEGREETAYGPVQGYVATRSSTGTKTDAPISEVPQSVSVVTRDQIDARGARTLAEALAYNAGVATGQRGESAGLGSANIVIRGFGGTGSLNEYWDGLQIAGTNFATSGIEPFLFERIEVLRGPTSVLYGQNQPGGVVNSVSKRPTAKRRGEVQALGGTFDTIELNLDVSGPIVDDGTLSYRVLAVISDEDGQSDFSGQARQVAAPSISWRPTRDTTLTTQLIYQNDDADGLSLRTLPAIGTLFDSPNGRLPRNRFAGEPTYNKWDREILSVAYFLEHDLTDKWSARQNFRYLKTSLDTELVYAVSLQGDNRTVNRSAFGLVEDSHLIAVDNQLEGDIETGPLSHNVLLGVDLQRRTGSTLRRFSAAPTLDLFAPAYFQTFPEPPIFQDADDTQFRLGLYGQNQIKFQRWILTLGGRHDWTDNELTNNRTDTTTETSDSAFTGRVGLGYAFENGITPYFSFAQSFQPQSGVDFNGDRFEPTTGEQYEIGVKYDVPAQNAFVTLSAFELTQQNVLTSDPVNTGFSVQTGEIRSRGIELEGVASLENGLDLIASYTFLDQEVTKSNDADKGKRPRSVPRQTASLWASYGFDAGWLDGIRLGGGVRYVGRSEGDTQNTFHVPSYTLFDASLNYDLSALGAHFDNWHVAVNATNLTDNKYVASCNAANSCFYGVGRSVIARLKYKWSE